MALSSPLDGQRLRLARKRRRLSRRQLAEALGVDARRVQQWEHGERTPASDIVPAIAELLLTKPEALLRRTHRSQPGEARTRDEPPSRHRR